MAPRLRIVLATLAGVLALVVVATGVRLGGWASGPPARAALQPPRFSDPPRLDLGILSRGRLPARLEQTWQRVVADGSVDLPELKGRPILVNFWASWCDPCRREAPLQRAWETKRGRVLFLGVNQNDSPGAAAAFLRRFSITYPSLRERGDSAARRWGVFGFPTTFFIASDGHAVARVVGPLRSAQLQRGIGAAQDEHWIRAGATAPVVRGAPGGVPGGKFAPRLVRRLAATPSGRESASSKSPSAAGRVLVGSAARSAASCHCPLYRKLGHMPASLRGST